MINGFQGLGLWFDLFIVVGYCAWKGGGHGGNRGALLGFSYVLPCADRQSFSSLRCRTSGLSDCLVLRNSEVSFFRLTAQNELQGG